jgi:hypothetical protein
MLTLVWLGLMLLLSLAVVPVVLCSFFKFRPTSIGREYYLSRLYTTPLLLSRADLFPLLLGTPLILIERFLFDVVIST